MHSKNNPTANTAQNLLTAGRSSWLGNVNVAAFGTKYQVIHRAGECERDSIWDEISGNTQSRGM